MSRITTKITVRDHIAEYARAKWGKDSRNPICIPRDISLYVLLENLLRRRPKTAPMDTGNLEIVLSCRHRGVKKPAIYNFLTKKSAKILDKAIEVQMWAEFHDTLDRKKHIEGYNYIHTIHSLLAKYSISSITDELLLKNYYRYRKRIRYTSVKQRSYRRKNET